MTMVKVATINANDVKHEVHFAQGFARNMPCAMTCDRWVGNQVINAKQSLHEFLYDDQIHNLYALEHKGFGTYTCDNKEVLLSFAATLPL